MGWRARGSRTGASRRGNRTDPQSWLIHHDQVLASLEIAHTRRAKRRGLLGRDGYEAALLLPGCRWVHTMGMRFPIDVAFCDRDGTVLRIVSMPPNRIGRPCWGARTAVESTEGAFASWSVRVGDRLDFQ
jgi:uncharacterized membrane protein (UPF0127 family)